MKQIYLFAVLDEFDKKVHILRPSSYVDLLWNAIIQNYVAICCKKSFLHNLNANFDIEKCICYEMFCLYHSNALFWKVRTLKLCFSRIKQIDKVRQLLHLHHKRSHSCSLVLYCFDKGKEGVENLRIYQLNILKKNSNYFQQLQNANIIRIWHSNVFISWFEWKTS